MRYGIHSVRRHYRRGRDAGQPQLPEITASQFQINPGTVLSSGEVSLDSWSTSGYEIPMLNIRYTGEEPLPEGTLYDFEMQVSDNPDFTNPAA